jgi:hypothetical protein
MKLNECRRERVIFDNIFNKLEQELTTKLDVLKKEVELYAE